jgi:hypothetical protein
LKIRCRVFFEKLVSFTNQARGETPVVASMGSSSAFLNYLTSIKPTQKPIHPLRIDVTRRVLTIGTMTDLVLDTIIDYFVE